MDARIVSLDQDEQPLATRAGLVETSVLVATLAHDGQVDKQGQSYVFHPLRVMELVRRIRPLDKIAQAAAVMHDVFEDTDFTEEVVRTALGPRPHRETDDVIGLVQTLTHKKGEPYFDYVRRVSLYDRARLIKAADVTDNQARLRGLDMDTRLRLDKKYGGAIEILRPPEKWRQVLNGHIRSLRGSDV